MDRFNRYKVQNKVHQALIKVYKIRNIIKTCSCYLKKYVQIQKEFYASVSCYS